MESLLTNLPGNFHDRLHVRTSGRMAVCALNQMIQDARASMSYSFKKHFYFLNCVCVEGDVFAHECSALRGQKRAPKPLELELHAAVNCLTWVLGSKL